MRRLKRGLLAVAAVAGIGLLAGAAWLQEAHGSYGWHVIWRRGGTFWQPVAADSDRLSPSMRLALATDGLASPGKIEWKEVSPGFEAGVLEAVKDGAVVDSIHLARIDPARFRFEVRSDPSGSRGLDEWMSEAKPALVVNGSYFGVKGEPDTPIVSGKRPQGPSDYDARSGAFVASGESAGIVDLRDADWKTTLRGADEAMVSYPMLVADGASRVTSKSRWLANRTFVGEDRAGRVIVGTTTDAFFSLPSLASFLVEAPLDLKRALNLDGGPVASQAISLAGFERKTYGAWEAQVDGDRVRLLTWPFGSYAMAMVLLVYPR